MIELNQKEKAFLVTVDVFAFRDKALKIEEEARELKELAMTSGVEVIEELTCHYDSPAPNLFIGKGKAKELSLIAAEHNVDVVIFSVDLSGTQQRNLEEAIGRKVIDRTQLILDIFSRHAKSPEGKTQVELAQLEYLLPRLTGKGIMLSRLGGGIGTSGPGEQKLELDRRRIRGRITRLKADLEKIRSQRYLIRKKRIAQKLPLIALVGYTNAGKTTLLNTLVNEHQLADNQLFTTLDPLSRILILPDHQKVIISDTVGFLHNLPHHLIEAFKATIEDVKEADLLVHVLDISSALRYEYHQAVEAVLKELACADKPVITVLNKADKLEEQNWIEKYKLDFPDSVAVSALKKENIEGFLSRISQKIPKNIHKISLSIPLDRMNLVDLIYREGKVEKIKYTSRSIAITAQIPDTLIHKFEEYLK